MTVTFRDEALNDLDVIARYIARDNPTAAVQQRCRNLLTDQNSVFERASRFCDRCAQQFAVTQTGLRELDSLATVTHHMG